MAEITERDAQQAILEQIVKLAPKVSTDSQSTTVRNLAEAFAWLVAPAQPHGGSATLKGG